MTPAKYWAGQFPTNIDSDAQIEPLIKRIQEDAREDFKPVVEALKRIYNFPVHSEPVGGAYNMQDIAHEALAHAEKLTGGVK